MHKQHVHIKVVEMVSHPTLIQYFCLNKPSMLVVVLKHAAVVLTQLVSSVAKSDQSTYHCSHQYNASRKTCLPLPELCSQEWNSVVCIRTSEVTTDVEGSLAVLFLARDLLATALIMYVLFLLHNVSLTFGRPEARL